MYIHIYISIYAEIDIQGDHRNPVILCFLIFKMRILIITSQGCRIWKKKACKAADIMSSRLRPSPLSLSSPSFQS